MDAENCDKDYRVLSIQSHVVSGYVGNKSACFPLQVLGFDVDFINSVQLSNHTGYKHIKGQRLNAEELAEIYDGLKMNNLISYSHILTGYVGTVTFLSRLVDIVKEIKCVNPDVYFVCDPVMGDNSQMYVPEEVLPIYRDHLLPLAQLITPNQFETQLLTGITIKTKEDVIQAMNILHENGVESVIISSVELDTHENLILFGSSIKDGSQNVFSMEIPKLQAVFTGTGDVLSALLLAWMTKTDGDLRVSCEKAINTLHNILKRTLKFATALENPTYPFALELKLIQSKKDIENPPTVLKSQLL